MVATAFAKAPRANALLEGFRRLGAECTQANATAGDTGLECCQGWSYLNSCAESKHTPPRN